jgi:hypothetical protein
VASPAVPLLWLCGLTAVYLLFGTVHIGQDRGAESKIPAWCWSAANFVADRT